MHSFIQKHRALLGGTIFLFIGVPMLFWSVPSNFMGPGQAPDTVATVGGVPIKVREYRSRLEQAATQQSMGGERLTFRQLDENGVANRILQEMIDWALLTNLAHQQGYDLSNDFLEARMQEDPYFQDAEGNFNPKAWNEWVQALRDAGENWNTIYDAQKERSLVSLYLNTRLASSNRVLDSEIDEQLEANHTKMVVKYFKLEPEVTPSEEQLQAAYEENKESYRKPDSLTAEYISISLRPEPGEEIRGILERAQGGEDFAALADEVSDIKTGNGGEIAGWQVLRDNEPDHRKPMFDLAVGEVSDIVVGPSGFYIYKVDEEQTNEETGKREIKARQIYRAAKLTDDERAALDNLAQAIADSANASGDLAAAAVESGLEPNVMTTPQFEGDAAEIEGIPAIDVRTFRSQLSARPEDEGFGPVPCQNAIYVAKVTGRAEGEIPPMEEVIERVEMVAKNKLKAEEAYQETVKEYSDKVASLATSLDDIPGLFPELNAQINETTEFSRTDFLFQQQIYVNTDAIYSAFEDAVPGKVSEPIQGMLGGTYFFELVSMSKPTEEDREGWEEEREELRLTAMRQAEMSQFEDLRTYVRDQMLGTVDVTLNQDVLNSVLGRDFNATEPAAEEAAPEAAPEGADAK